MGCFHSGLKRHPGYQDPIPPASQTAFSVSDVQALFELFKSISGSVIDDGLIYKAEFHLALCGKKTDNLFANRLFDTFDVKKRGFIDFADFVIGLNIFHPNIPTEEKVHFSFRLYDMENTGFIERKEVISSNLKFYFAKILSYFNGNKIKQMIIALLIELGIRLSDESIESILDKTFSDADVNQDRKIDKAEWENMVSRNPSLMKIMTLPCLKDITTTFPSFVFHSEVDDILT